LNEIPYFLVDFVVINPSSKLTVGAYRLQLILEFFCSV
jgi:hypothetical protein